jgi:hypothetical protein
MKTATGAVQMAALRARTHYLRRPVSAVIDSAMGRNGGNSRGGARIVVHEDEAKLLYKKTARPGVDSETGCGSGD